MVTIGRWYPYDPEEGIVNTANLGYAPMDLLFARSSDAGWSWDGGERIAGGKMIVAHGLRRAGKLGLKPGLDLLDVHIKRVFNRQDTLEMIRETMTEIEIADGIPLCLD